MVSVLLFLLMYGDPERWKDAQRDGFIRDDKGKIMAPLYYVFKRNTITNKRNLTNKIDANRLHASFNIFKSLIQRKMHIVNLIF